MRDERKAKKQLVEELAELRQRVAELEVSEAECKRAKEALRESEERLRSLFEGAEDHIFVVDQDFRYVTVNPSALKAGGFTLEDVVGKGPRELFPEDAEFYFSQYRHAFETGEPVRFERELRLPDGPRYFSVTLSPIKDARGCVTALTGISRDITARKRAEEGQRKALAEALQATHALQESEEHLREVFEHSQDALYKRNLETGRYEYMSPAIATITGYTPDEAMAMSPDEIDSLIHPEDMEWLSDLRRNVLGTPQDHEIVSSVEYRVKCKDGSYRWISDHYALLRGPEGRPLFSVASVRDITARKQVEETLRESEEKYRRLVEDSAEGIAIVQRLEMRFVNRVLLDMFGCQSEDEMVGHPFIDFVAPESRNLMLERGQAREAGERVPSHYEFKALRKDGTEFDAEISVSQIAYQGDVARQGTIRDVTARKRAEEALRESEEKYRNLVSTINDLIFTVDVEGTVLFANPAAKAFTGYAPEETVGHNFAEYVHPDDIPELLARIQQVLSGEPLESVKGVGQESEYRMVRQDGKVIWVAVRTQPIRDPREKIIGFSGIARDITERKQAEEALELRVRQLTSLSQASRAVNASLELDQVLAEIVSLAGAATGGDYTSVVLVDEAGQLGRSAENLPGVPSIEHRIRDEGLTNWVMRSWQAVVVDEIGTDGTMRSPLNAESPRFANPSIVETGIKSIASLPLLAQDRLLGVLHLYSLRPSAFHGQLPVLMTFAGQAATAIVNARLFAETQAAYEQLQQTHEQLVQSAKMATIGTLAAGVAHEINNPMTGVLGFAELLLRNTAPDDPARKDLTVIVTEARRVRGIVRNLLSFSRQTTPHREKANINQMILETLALVRQRLEKTGVILEERYTPALPSLRLDVGQMRQVALNLIVNAIQATSRGDTLTVSTEWVGDEVAVRVADTGEGIPAENLSRIFEPFFTTRPIGQGTGLGLSISQGIVQDHGGRIEVESQVGKGSTFTVYLPIE